MEEVTNGWNEWGTHVIKELERLNEHCDKLDDKQEAIKVEIHQTCLTIQAEINKSDQITKVELAKLKMKAGMWGAMAGMVPPCAILLIWLAKLALQSSGV